MGVKEFAQRWRDYQTRLPEKGERVLIVNIENTQGIFNPDPDNGSNPDPDAPPYSARFAIPIDMGAYPGMMFFPHIQAIDDAWPWRAHHFFSLAPPCPGRPILFPKNKLGQPMMYDDKPVAFSPMRRMYCESRNVSLGVDSSSSSQILFDNRIYLDEKELTFPGPEPDYNNPNEREEALRRFKERDEFLDDCKRDIEGIQEEYNAELRRYEVDLDLYTHELESHVRICMDRLDSGNFDKDFWATTYENSSHPYSYLWVRATESKDDIGSLFAFTAGYATSISEWGIDGSLIRYGWRRPSGEYGGRIYVNSLRYGLRKFAMIFNYGVPLAKDVNDIYFEFCCTVSKGTTPDRNQWAIYLDAGIIDETDANELARRIASVESGGVRGTVEKMRFLRNVSSTDFWLIKVSFGGFRYDSYDFSDDSDVVDPKNVKFNDSIGLFSIIFRHAETTITTGVTGSMYPVGPRLSVDTVEHGPSGYRYSYPLMMPMYAESFANVVTGGVDEDD